MARKKNYLNNKNILAEVLVSKANDNTLTPKLGHMLLTLAERYSKKPNFVGYSYREDMVGFALLQLMRTLAGESQSEGESYLFIIERYIGLQKQ